MRRALIGIATLAFAAGSATTVLAAAGPPGKPGHPSVSVADCHTADDIAQRYASFSAQMRALTGTTRMAVHFTLLERLGGADGFQSVPLSNLHTWRRSKPGARTFIYTQRVTALHDGGYYRMRVQFRWYGSGGSVLRTSVSSSGVCHQPMPLPDLTISSITAAAGTTPGKRTYSVTLANGGAGEARGAVVALKVDGSVVGSSSVDLLPAGESTLVHITGPACAMTVRAVADPDGLVRETDESDNALTLPCPPSSSG